MGKLVSGGSVINGATPSSYGVCTLENCVQCSCTEGRRRKTHKRRKDTYRKDRDTTKEESDTHRTLLYLAVFDVHFLDPARSKEDAAVLTLETILNETNIK